MECWLWYLFYLSWSFDSPPSTLSTKCRSPAFFRCRSVDGMALQLISWHAKFQLPREFSLDSLFQLNRQSLSNLVLLSSWSEDRRTGLPCSTAARNGQQPLSLKTNHLICHHAHVETPSEGTISDLQKVRHFDTASSSGLVWATSILNPAKHIDWELLQKIQRN